MLSHYPQFHRGAGAGLVPKIGGLPHGLPARLWPVCKECGLPMSHLLQLPVDKQILPEMHEDEVLFVFKCESEDICSFWDGDGSANAVFTVPRKELCNTPTSAPANAEGETPLQVPEFGIVGWRSEDDGAPEELEAAFYDYAAHDKLPESVSNPHDWESSWRTKVGGVPSWTANGAQNIPAGRFVLQIDNWINLDDGSSEEFANFCSDGTAYIFADRSQQPPTYSMIINR